MIRDPSLPATLTFLHLSPPQSYTGQTGGSGGGGSGTAGGNGPRDEDYEIPPITPPNHPEPPPLHLMEHDSTGYLCHSLPHNGLINPYSYPELPTLMMSNMLAQESHLVSNQMPSGLVGKSISVIPTLTAHIGQSVKPSDTNTR
ncbi:TOX high mobility group box family member 2 [Takifugu flavidus]|uniref:TOX high mobility group box family member 2 n=1 Tax=Takifugu flavidus TaxID=433684 RepID=A0A5C6N5A4_9TELE|nr:TOX high mobility group box family member 2 [Takifugu flavidus]